MREERNITVILCLKIKMCYQFQFYQQNKLIHVQPNCIIIIIIIIINIRKCVLSTGLMKVMLNLMNILFQ